MRAGDAARLLAARLAAAGLDSPRLDARLLVEAAAGLSREQLVLDPARALTAPEAGRLAAFIERRLAREPVTRILGERPFHGRTFRVSPATLDPRPETETLVELALDLVREEGLLNGPLQVLDIGTGTGCILLTLLAELGPGPVGLGVDVSAAALEVARDNAARLGLSERARWQLIGGLTEIAVAGGPVLVVSNPPYIASADIAGLEPEVRCHDPMLALDGGPDGLDVVRQIVAWSAGLARTWVAIELGAGQATTVEGLVRQHCGADVAADLRRRADLGGHIRCVSWKPRREMPHERLLAGTLIEAKVPPPIEGVRRPARF